MLDPEKLISELGSFAAPSTIPIESVVDEIKLGSVFVIDAGSILATFTQKLDSGTSLTQTFRRGDPLGFAETLSQSPLKMTFKSIEPVSLFKIDGNFVKQTVEKSGVLAKEIIRYSLARTFGRSRKRPNALFEDWLLEKYRKDIVRLVFEEGEFVFHSKSMPDCMFFIEKGEVSLLTENQKTLATLQVTDCFGEASLISTRKRSVSAVAIKRCTLLKLDAIHVEEEIRSEHPLVQLTVIQLLRRVHLMNQMRLIESGDMVYQG